MLQNFECFCFFVFCFRIMQKCRHSFSLENKIYKNQQQQKENRAIFKSLRLFCFFFHANFSFRLVFFLFAVIICLLFFFFQFFFCLAVDTKITYIKINCFDKFDNTCNLLYNFVFSLCIPLKKTGNSKEKDIDERKIATQKFEHDVYLLLKINSFFELPLAFDCFLSRLFGGLDSYYVCSLKSWGT